MAAEPCFCYLKLFCLDILDQTEYVKSYRNRRAADSQKNTTGAKLTVDWETILKINKLLSEPNLNSVIQMAIAVSQALPVHRDQRETKDPGDEEDTEETKALWDLLEKVAARHHGISRSEG